MFNDFKMCLVKRFDKQQKISDHIRIYKLSKYFTWQICIGIFTVNSQVMQILGAQSLAGDAFESSKSKVYSAQKFPIFFYWVLKPGSIWSARCISKSLGTIMNSLWAPWIFENIWNSSTIGFYIFEIKALSFKNYYTLRTGK